MRLDLYQAETARIAAEQAAILNEAHSILASGKELSRLEQNGILHALQVLVENAIGKSKQLIKSTNEPVPVSAYDAFESLARSGGIMQTDLAKWNSVIGLRNRIVHEYMAVDMHLIFELVNQKQYLFITDFLCKSITFHGLNK